MSVKPIMIDICWWFFDSFKSILNFQANKLSFSSFFLGLHIKVMCQTQIVLKCFSVSIKHGIYVWNVWFISIIIIIIWLMYYFVDRKMLNLSHDFMIIGTRFTFLWLWSYVENIYATSCICKKHILCHF